VTTYMTWKKRIFRVFESEKTGQNRATWIIKESIYGIYVNI
jgi:hypothetical protein